MKKNEDLNKKNYTNYEKYLQNNLKKSNYRKKYEQELKRLRYAYKISQLRKSEDLSQKEFAKKIKTTQSVISRIERGHQNVSSDYLERIASALNKELVFEFKDKNVGPMK